MWTCQDTNQHLNIPPDRDPAGVRYRRRRLTGAGLLALFAFAAGFGVVHAGSAYSSYNYYSMNGYSYKARASIHTDHANNHSAHAGTNINTYNCSGTGCNAPSGWMGALPQRRNSSGALLCTGTWLYNGGAASGLGAVGCFINNHSIYSSQGATRAWTGSTYSTTGTFLSPNQNS